MKERINVKLPKIDEKNAPFPNKAVTTRSKNNKIYSGRDKPFCVPLTLEVKIEEEYIYYA